MNDLIDFSNCKRAHVHFGGKRRKRGLVYDDHVWMLKFSGYHVGEHSIATYGANYVTAEYISTHIASAIGIPTQETSLGVYHDEIIVACKDFRQNARVSNIEFAEYVRARYGNRSVAKPMVLHQLYEILATPINDIPQQLQRESIERYWDMFVIDALVGNANRSAENWSFLACENMLQLAPAYAFGNSLFPQLTDDMLEEMLSDKKKLQELALAYPSPMLALADAESGKAWYYEMMASGRDDNCTEAVLRIVPRIAMKKIDDIVDHTPLITDVRKEFYKAVLHMRKELILDKAYKQCAQTVDWKRK